MRSAARRAMPRLVLAGLLFAMAAGQLSNPAGFVDVLASYDLGGTLVATVGAAALIAGELIAAVGLVSHDPSRRHRATSVALVVALTWSVLAAQAFARGLALDNCGCFGVHLAQPLRWWILVEDVEFVALAWWVRARSSTGAATGSSPLWRGVRTEGPDRRAAGVPGDGGSPTRRINP